ncbi:MAG: transposase, partial [Devosia sp.]
MGRWIDIQPHHVAQLGDEGEVDASAFSDVRLGRRFADLLHRFSDRIGATIPLACQDWANTKAAYRFFANPNVEE